MLERLASHMPLVILFGFLGSLIVIPCPPDDTPVPDFLLWSLTILALYAAWGTLAQVRLIWDHRRWLVFRAWRDSRCRWPRCWRTCDCHEQDCRNLAENWDVEGLGHFCMFYERSPDERGEKAEVCPHYAWADEFPEGEEALMDCLTAQPKVREAAERAARKDGTQ